jgi:hypothetical protein
VTGPTGSNGVAGSNGAGSQGATGPTGFAGDLSLYAPLLSPGFAGAPTGPSPPAGNNSTRLATTAYVQGELGSYLTLCDGQRAVHALCGRQGEHQRARRCGRLGRYTFVMEATHSTTGVYNMTFPSYGSSNYMCVATATTLLGVPHIISYCEPRANGHNLSNHQHLGHPSRPRLLVHDTLSFRSNRSQNMSLGLRAEASMYRNEYCSSVASW